MKMPILLARNGRLDGYAKNLLMYFGTIYVAGDESCCYTSEIESVAGKKPIRLSGQNRFETSKAIAEKFSDVSSLNALCAADGADAHYPDALCGGALAGKLGSPVILTSRWGQDYKGLDYLKKAEENNISPVYVLGSAGNGDLWPAVRNIFDGRYQILG